MKQVKKVLAVAALPLMLSLYSAPSQAGQHDISQITSLACQYFGIWCDTKTDQQVTVSVPEPGTLALLGLGLAATGLARRKSKK